LFYTLYSSKRVWTQIATAKTEEEEGRQGRRGKGWGENYKKEVSLDAYTQNPKLTKT